nr:glycogen debranching N-terminal domain-containing protein [Streptomyces sp. AJS327]
MSGPDGQLRGTGMEGFYRAGRRTLSQCWVMLAGEQPIALDGRMVNSSEARFLATAPTPPGAGPDPVITVERLRSAVGTERVTVRSAADRRLRVPLEVRLACDLAELGAVAVGREVPSLSASVSGPGLSWSAEGLKVTAAAEPGPDAIWARSGLLCWDWELEPGESRTVLLTIALQPAPDTSEMTTASSPEGRRGLTGPRSAPPPAHWALAEVDADDATARPLFRTSLNDLGGLLLRDPERPADVHLAAGAPWRCVFSPAESLRAARMLLPLGTALAAGTLRTLARGQRTEPGPESGRLPGPLRHGGPGMPPCCTGIEATLLFPTVLAEARFWGLPESEVEALLPVTVRCLEWMTRVAEEGYVPDPEPGGPYRCVVQAQAYRAALLGAELLDAHGWGDGAGLREFAAALRKRFLEDFWPEELQEEQPFAQRYRDGRTVSRLGGSIAELLDTGLVSGGRMASGLLDPVRTRRLTELLSGPSLDSGRGLRSLGTDDPAFNPFGHHAGAVHTGESVLAAVGLASAGCEKEAAALVRGTLDAAVAFGRRLPEMYAVDARGGERTVVPHPVACRPSAVAAAGIVHLVTAVAGLRPDVPGGSVTLRPMASAPLGAVRLSGLSVGQRPFSVRVSAEGMGLVEEAADSLRLGGCQR